eukprot:4869291-Pleurochrysis_carterae.AAC.1
MRAAKNSSSMMGAQPSCCSKSLLSRSLDAKAMMGSGLRLKLALGSAGHASRLSTRRPRSGSTT